MRTFLLLLALSTCATAQEVEAHKQILQRQQASDAFAQQLRQSQEMLRVPAQRRQEAEARQLGERHRLDNVSAKQQAEVKAETPNELRPVERQHAADERRPYVVPAGGIIEVVPRPRS
jgi:type IV secretory pathway VirB10-like protein